MIKIENTEVMGWEAAIRGMRNPMNPWDANNKWLKSHILEYRNGSQSACLEVIDKFSRLISVYSSRLKDEDSFYDMILFLLELMNRIDLYRWGDDDGFSLQHYIAKCIRYEYIKMGVVEQREEEHLTFADPSGLDRLDPHTIINTVHNRLIFNGYLAPLSDKQIKVVLLHYGYSYSIQEIADILHISRQSANQLKNRALCTIRKEINYDIQKQKM